MKEKIDIDNNIYYSVNNCLIEKATKTLISGCKTSVIPCDIITIGNSAFENCKELTEISIPKSVTKINYKAFANCIGLKILTIFDKDIAIEDFAFVGCKNLTVVNVIKNIESDHRCINALINNLLSKCSAEIKVIYI